MLPLLLAALAATPTPARYAPGRRAVAAAVASPARAEAAYAPAPPQPGPVSSASPQLSLPHRLVPPRAPSPGKPPILIVLHGYGANEDDLAPLGASLDPRLLVVSPRALLPMGPGRARWFDIRDDDSVRSEQVVAAIQAVLRFADEAVRAYDADPERVYLAGFSQGAMLALACGLLEPERFRGVAALSGSLVPEAERQMAPKAALAGLSVFISHGTRDDVLPVAYARAARDRLQALPVKLTYLEFEGGHRIPPEVRDALARWAVEGLGPLVTTP